LLSLSTGDRNQLIIHSASFTWKVDSCIANEKFYLFAKPR
jgi:hypothetical protein